MNAHRPPRPRRDPFELWIAAVCVLTGLVALLVDAERTGVVDRYLPAAADLWYVGLAVSGAVTLVGCALPGRSLRGRSRLMSVEAVGLWLLSGLLLGYGLAVEVASPLVPSGLLVVGLGVASAARAIQVRAAQRDLRKAVVAFTELHTNDPPTD